MKKISVIFFTACLWGCGQSSDPKTQANETNPNGYNKIEWQAMDADKDGSVSPEEMKEHYKEKGVYKED